MSNRKIKQLSHDIKHLYSEKVVGTQDTVNLENVFTSLDHPQCCQKRKEVFPNIIHPYIDMRTHTFSKDFLIHQRGHNCQMETIDQKEQECCGNQMEVRGRQKLNPIQNHNSYVKRAKSMSSKRQFLEITKIKEKGNKRNFFRNIVDELNFHDHNQVHVHCHRNQDHCGECQNCKDKLSEPSEHCCEEEDPPEEREFDVCSVQYEKQISEPNLVVIPDPPSPCREEQKEETVIIPKRKTIYIKKHQIDPTAGFFYGLGCSLIHFSMFCTAFVVQWPNQDYAKQLDEEYLQEILILNPQIASEVGLQYQFCGRQADQFHFLIYNFMIAHALCYVITIYREIFEPLGGQLGQFMKCFEVFGMFYYFQAIFQAMREYITWIVLDLSSSQIGDILMNDTMFHAHLFTIKAPIGLENRSEFDKFRGRVLEWFLLEILVFIFFVITMLILMIKSRCMKVGIDNSYQFEPTYMSYLVNRLIQSIDFDFEEKYRTKEQTRLKWTRRSHLDLGEIEIKTRLTQADYDSAYKKAYLGEKNNFVCESDATAWIERNTIGHINKEELEEQRTKEVNDLDMMQNNSIIYHSESILETQILCLVVIFFIQKHFQKNDQDTQDIEEDQANILIMATLFVEHILSYICQYFRVYDIKVNGKVDIRGVRRAPTELLLQQIEIFFDCILIGFILKRFLELSIENFHNEAYITYWIIIDCFLLFLQQGYNYVCITMQSYGEINKNLYSLLFVQNQKIRRLRLNQARNQIISSNKMADNIKLKLINDIDRELVGKSKEQNDLQEEFQNFQNLKDEVDFDKQLGESDVMIHPTRNPQQLQLNSQYSSLVDQEQSLQVNKYSNKGDETGFLQIIKNSHFMDQTRNNDQSHQQLNQYGQGQTLKFKEVIQKTQSATKKQLRRTMTQYCDNSDSSESSDTSGVSSDSDDPVRTFKKMGQEASQSHLGSMFLTDREIRIRQKAQEREIAIKTASKLRQKMRNLNRNNTIEMDFLASERLVVTMDVYNLTIAANMTRNCSPLMLNFCIKQCFIVFLIQMLIIYLFLFEYLDLNNFQPFTMKQTSLRLICSILLQIHLYEELQIGIKMLTFIKRQRLKKQHAKIRCFNVLLCSMQIITPLSVFVVLLLTLGQEKQFSNIIKDYVTLAFLITIDNIFVTSLPQDIKQNAVNLNKSGILKMGRDFNTFKHILKRQNRESADLTDRFIGLMNVIINIWWLILISIQRIFFNYFAAYMCIVVQYIGYQYQQQTNRRE